MKQIQLKNMTSKALAEFCIGFMRMTEYLNPLFRKDDTLTLAQRNIFEILQFLKVTHFF